MKNNNIHISIPVSGLIKRENYRYEILGLGGNWPSVAIPRTGSFEATAKTTSINTSISFCASTGLAINLSNVLPYEPLQCGYANQELFTSLKAKVVSLSDNSEIFSSQQLVQCTGCLPNINIELSGCGSEVCDQYILSDSNIFNFVSSFSGLEAGASYNYSLYSLGSNWPCIMASPKSGTFVPTSDTYDMQHRLVFCANSGECSSNHPGSMNHNMYVKNTDEAKIFNTIQLSVTPQSCNGEMNFSNSIMTICDDCLPCIKYGLVTISGSPQISLSGECCTSSSPKLMIVEVYNANPGEKYMYKFTNANMGLGSIGFVPASGDIYFGENGNGNIYTYLVPNLSLYERSLVTVELTHDRSQHKIYDSIAVRCGLDVCSSET